MIWRSQLLGGIIMNNAVRKSYEALAAQAGLVLDAKNGVIYGKRNGFDVIVYAADTRYPYLITVALAVSRDGGCLGKDVWKGFVKEHKPVQNVKNEGNVLNMVLSATSNQQKFCGNFMESFDVLTSFLIANGYINCCQLCGQPTDTQVYCVGNGYAHLCPSCAARVSQDINMAGQQKREKKDNIPAGIVGALIGSLVGVLCIVLIGQLGYVAVISGIVMAICTLKGYELLGGKLSTVGIIVSCILMLIMTYVGNQLDWAIVVMRELGYDFFYSFQLIPTLIDQQAIEASSFWGNLALVYVFVVIGAVPTISSMIKNQKNQGRMFKIGG